MSNYPTIAQVLHLAADKFLAHDPKSHGDAANRFSCVAVISALDELYLELSFDYDKLKYDTMRFLGDLGLDIYTDEDQFYEFLDEYDERLNEASQGARFLWLEFAALIAEEEGV